MKDATHAFQEIGCMSRPQRTYPSSFPWSSHASPLWYLLSHLPTEGCPMSNNSTSDKRLTQIRTSQQQYIYLTANCTLCDLEKMDAFVTSTRSPITATDLPLSKYTRTYPRDSKSSLLLCSVQNRTWNFLRTTILRVGLRLGYDGLDLRIAKHTYQDQDDCWC
jgi:hypothetical protein